MGLVIRGWEATAEPVNICLVHGCEGWIQVCVRESSSHSVTQTYFSFLFLPSA